VNFATELLDLSLTHLLLNGMFIFSNLFQLHRIATLRHDELGQVGFDLLGNSFYKCDGLCTYLVM
jgi:hypothetical protein